MSAIWGYLNFSALEGREGLTAENKRIMREAYGEYAIDRFGEESFDEGFFACGIQHFNDRAQNEVLPIFDVEKGYVFTADIVLNARTELIKDLEKEGAGAASDLDKEPDGTLAYKSWLLWKEKLTDHIQGVFAIAVYDMNNKEFYLFSDHMGVRAITYTVTDNEIFFSTLPQVIYSCLPKDKRSIDEKWIAGCESSACPGMCLFEGLTPFTEITQLVRGRMLKISASDGNSLKHSKGLTEYWNPLKNKADRLNLDPAGENSFGYYKKLFRQIYFDCIRDCIDTDKEVAVTLSSGLDSSSVATIAATFLAERNKELYSYTSVPLKDYRSDLGADVITDESAGVKKICEKYRNIVPEFVSCDGKSPYTEAKRLVSLTATPSKSLSNEVWIDEINRRAAERGCKMLLIGHYGNLTVSNGRVLGRVYQELRRGHIAQAKRQLAAYGRRYGVTRKELLRGTMAEFNRELAFRLSMDKGYKESFDQKYLKKELLKKYKIVKTQKDIFRQEGYSELVSRKQANRFILDEVLAQEISISDTAASLTYGILTRDPTRDKRIVELMVSLPPEQFTDDGLERRLIRAYLDDLIPDEIRMEAFKRGRQGADLVLRLQNFGSFEVSKDPDAAIYKYFDYENVQKLAKEELSDKNAFDKVRVMSLDLFLDQYGE